MNDRQIREYLGLSIREFFIYKALLYKPFMTFDMLVAAGWFGRKPAWRQMQVTMSIRGLRLKLGLPIQNRHSVGYTITEPSRTQHRLQYEKLLAMEPEND